MSRGYSECCHYDEGYDDGLSDGREESGADTEVGAIADALRMYAREEFVGGDLAAADLLERIADHVACDENFERRMEKEKQRQADIVAAYAEARKETL